MLEAQKNTEHVDILIIGAGPTGIALALALMDSPWRVLLLDKAPRDAWQNDPRALALAYGSKLLLERLGAFPDAATPIREIHIAQSGGFSHTLITEEEHRLPALGYVARYPDLMRALSARLDPEQLIDQCCVNNISSGALNNCVSVTRHAAENSAEGDASWDIVAKLVVHAEGAQPTPSSAQIKTHDYQQTAIVAEARPSVPHYGRAWERFTPDGPLGLLPLGADYSVVCALPPAKAQAMLDMPDAEFLSALQNQFGETGIQFLSCSARSSFPLVRRVREPLSDIRQVWIGNAAQALHPVSGQGFNLALRDAWELAETLFELVEQRGSIDNAGNAAIDPGQAQTLAAYLKRRQLDRQACLSFTDSLVRIFSNEFAPLKLARGLGLLALDLAPPLRHFIAKRLLYGARTWF